MSVAVFGRASSKGTMWEANIVVRLEADFMCAHFVAIGKFTADGVADTQAADRKSLKATVGGPVGKVLGN